MGHQYWVKSGDKIKGPFTGKQLIDLASANKLKRHYLISSDHKKWVRASRVKGLVFPNLPSSSDTSEVVAGGTGGEERPNVSKLIEVTELRPKSGLAMSLTLAEDALTLAGGSMEGDFSVSRGDICKAITGGPLSYHARTHARKYKFLVSEDDAGAISEWLGKEYRENQLFRTSKDKAFWSGLAFFIVTLVFAGQALSRASMYAQTSWGPVDQQAGMLSDPVVLLYGTAAVGYLMTTIILVITTRPWAVLFAGIVSIPLVLLNVANLLYIIFAPAERFSIGNSLVSRGGAFLLGLACLLVISSTPLQGAYRVHSMSKWVSDPHQQFL